jgi:nicotinamidase-related amidase
MASNAAEEERAMYGYVYGEKRALPEGFDDFFDVRRTAVVSIDMHRGHLEDSPDCPCPAPRAREIVGPIDRFHDACRRIGVPVIHVETRLRRGGVDDVKGNVAAWRKVFPLYVGPIPNAEAHALEGSKWTEFVTAVDPDRDLLVTTKKRLSVFYPTDLDFLLRNIRKETVVLNGGFTDCCVLNAAFDASNRDFNVVVLRDLVRGTNAEMEDAALRIISLHLGVVTDSGEVLRAWQAQAVHP